MANEGNGSLAQAVRKWLYLPFALVYYPLRAISEFLRVFVSVIDDTLCAVHVWFCRGNPRRLVGAVLRENLLMVQKRKLSRIVGFWLNWIERKAIAFAVICIDFRFDSADFFGPFKRWTYVAGIPGSANTRTTMEAATLAVDVGGVEVVMLTSHRDDCTARKSLFKEAIAAIIPNLKRAIEEQLERVKNFLQIPVVKRRMEEGSLGVVFLDINTKSRKMTEMGLEEWASPPSEDEHTHH